MSAARYVNLRRLSGRRACEVGDARDRPERPAVIREQRNHSDESSGRKCEHATHARGSRGGVEQQHGSDDAVRIFHRHGETRNDPGGEDDR